MCSSDLFVFVLKSTKRQQESGNEGNSEDEGVTERKRTRERERDGLKGSYFHRGPAAPYITYVPRPYPFKSLTLNFISTERYR